MGRQLGSRFAILLSSVEAGRAATSPNDVARNSVLTKVALFSESDNSSKPTDKEKIIVLKARINEQDELITSLRKQNAVRGGNSEEYEKLRRQVDAAAGWERGAMMQIEQLRRENSEKGESLKSLLRRLRESEARTAPQGLNAAPQSLELAEQIGVMEVNVTALEKLLLRASVGAPRQNQESKSVPTVQWPPTPASSGSKPRTPERRDVRNGRPPSGPNPEHIMKVLLPNLSRKIQEQEATIEEQKSIIVSLRQELDTVASELFDSRGEADKMKETISRLRKEVKETTVNLSDQSRELAQHKTTVITLQNEVKGSMSKLAEKDTSIAKLEARLSSPEAVNGLTDVDPDKAKPVEQPTRISPRESPPPQRSPPQHSPPLQLQTTNLKESQKDRQPELLPAKVSREAGDENEHPPPHNTPPIGTMEFKQSGAAVHSLKLPDLSSKYALAESPRRAVSRDQNGVRESADAKANKEDNVRGGSHGWASTPERWSMFAGGNEVKERKAGSVKKKTAQAAEGEEAASRRDEDNNETDTVHNNLKASIPRARQSAPVTIGALDSPVLDADAADGSSEAQEIEEVKEAIKALVEQSTYRAWDPEFKSSFRM
eukprot:3941407-Rhodomonas_salina.4